MWSRRVSVETRRYSTFINLSITIQTPAFPGKWTVLLISPLTIYRLNCGLQSDWLQDRSVNSLYRCLGVWGLRLANGIILVPFHDFMLRVSAVRRAGWFLCRCLFTPSPLRWSRSQTHSKDRLTPFELEHDQFKHSSYEVILAQHGGVVLESQYRGNPGGSDVTSRYTLCPSLELEVRTLPSLSRGVSARVVSY